MHWGVDWCAGSIVGGSWRNQDTQRGWVRGLTSAVFDGVGNWRDIATKVRIWRKDHFANTIDRKCTFWHSAGGVLGWGAWVEVYGARHDIAWHGSRVVTRQADRDWGIDWGCTCVVVRHWRVEAVAINSSVICTRHNIDHIWICTCGLVRGYTCPDCGGQSCIINQNRGIAQWHIEGVVAATRVGGHNNWRTRGWGNRDLGICNTLLTAILNAIAVIVKEDSTA